ncbi:MAG: MFS transporter, partial [Chloroflexota bacterium]|nr:MFS transporter [Chloroflexota bacterium]
MDVTVKPERAARRAPAYALLGGTASSQVGNQLAALAIPWFVLQTSGSATRTGLVAAFTILPTALASFFGGAVVDRIGSRWLSIVADQLSGVIVAMIPLLHHTIGLGFVPLLALVFLGALFDSPGNTARMALLPEVAKPARMRLEQANAFSQTIQGLSSLLGPPLAGFLIVAMGTSTVLWLEATSFAVSALLVALAVPAPSAKTVPVGSYFDDVREGWRFLWADRLLRAIALTSTVINFLLAPLFAVVLPVYADRVFGS